MRKSVTYFEKSGPENTLETIKLAYERAVELGVTDIVVATIHGETALKVAETFGASRFNIVAVTMCEGWESEEYYIGTPSLEERAKLRDKGVKVLTCIQALGDDVNSAFTEKFGGRSFNQIVTQTLYRFCQGMKVCVEIVLMAADAGLIGVDGEVVAIAGSEKGADTAIVAKPAYTRKFLDLRIKEIIAKPRDGKTWEEEKTIASS